MISVRKCINLTARTASLLLMAGLMLNATAVSAGPLCKENNSDRKTQDCDMRYRNTVLTCKSTYKAEDTETHKEIELPSLYPVCSKKPIAMKSTEKRSFKDVSPYLYAFPLDLEKSKKEKGKMIPLSDEMIRGTPGGLDQVFSPIGETPEGVPKMPACINQLEIDGLEVKEIDDFAKLVRLQLDNCANQYILQTAATSTKSPFYKAASQQFCSTKDKTSRFCSLEDLCQPLKALEDPRQEYMPSVYLKLAWEKLMQKADAVKTDRAKGKTEDGMEDCKPDNPDRPANCEPMYPPNVKISSEKDNKIEFSPSFGEIRINAIAAVEYEEILDPSHPFSPRWDFEWDERTHYSPMVRPYQSKGHSNKKAVYCAGNRADSGDPSKDQDYRVDVLSFRKDAFDKGMGDEGRIGFNKACMRDFGPGIGDVATIRERSYCYTMVDATTAAGQSCWRCFGLKPGVQVDDEVTHPPCTTRWDGKDLKIVNTMSGNKVFPGKLNDGKRTAYCNTKPNKKKVSITKLCEDLRAPFTPINKLKMRYHNPDGKPEDGGGKETVVLKEGVLEGLQFNDYFYDEETKHGHMPYPRLWDTGRSIQKRDETTQNARDSLGQFTAIVGVGREAAPDAVNNGLSDDKKHEDERCMYGGWGGKNGDKVDIGGSSIKLPDPITSWTELKLYQAYTSRETRLTCLGRYDKAFKHRSTENQMLQLVGGSKPGFMIVKCAKDKDGNASQKCEYLDYATHKDDPVDSNNFVTMQASKHPWPLIWRGYLSAKDEDKRFPDFGQKAKGIHTGLDNAHCGDIVIMPEGGSTNPDKPGLPKLARVKQVNLPNKSSCDSKEPSNCEKLKNCYIEVEEADNGKWPDVCGTTDMAGELKTRTMFKPGHMPQADKDRLKKSANWISSCEDTRLQFCEMLNWDKLKLYRPVEDIRK